MSIEQYINKVAQLTKEKASLEKSATQERSNIYRVKREIASILRTITKNTSPLTLHSKQRQIESKEKQLASYELKVADLEKKIADKLSQITKAIQSLERVEQQENMKKDREDKKKRDGEIKHQKNITREIERQARLQAELSSSHLVIDLTTLPEKIKVLFFASNPADQTQLKLDEEIRAITRKIRESEFRDSVELVSVWAVRPNDLLQALNEHKPAIVHFSGHGSDSDEIIFQDDTGNSKPISKSAIIQMFKVMASGIQLAVFNTCFSRSQAEEITEYIDAAIGMSTEIGDEAAKVFAAQFYSAIGFGKSIKEAFDQAIVALMLEGIPEHDTPELFTRPEIDPHSLVMVKPS